MKRLKSLAMIVTGNTFLWSKNLHAAVDGVDLDGGEVGGAAVSDALRWRTTVANHLLWIFKSRLPRGRKVHCL